MTQKRWMALVVAGALGLAACGGDDGNGDAGGTTVADTDTGAGGDDDAGTGEDGPGEDPAGTDEDGDDATPSSDGAPSGVFRFGDTLPITTLDPHRSTGGGYNVWLFPVYDRLVHVTPTNEAAPGLATDWEFSDDGLTLTMNLREGVQFHDGTPFDADAVKANIERGQTDELSAVTGDLGIFSAVEVIDEHTVALTLEEPNATAPLVLSERGGAIASPAAFDQLELQPVGTGMFRVTDFEPSVSATYEHNPDYWDPDAVNVERMEFTTITESLQRANALRAGEIDATILEPLHVAEVESAGYAIDASPNFVFWHLQMNRTRAGFDDVRVRQALNYAIDREALVEGILLGYGSPTAQPFPPGTLGHYAPADDVYSYDPDRARELLDEAGATDLEFEIVTLNIPSFVQIAEAVQAQLADVGITTTISETTNVAQTFYIEETGDATVILYTGRPDPSLGVAVLYTDFGTANPGRHTTPEVMDLYRRSVAETDPDARTEILDELSMTLVEQALGVILYFPDNVLAYADGVTGYQNWASGKLEFRGVDVAD